MTFSNHVLQIIKACRSLHRKPHNNLTLICCTKATNIWRLAGRALSHLVGGLAFQSLTVAIIKTHTNWRSTSHHE